MKLDTCIMVLERKNTNSRGVIGISSNLFGDEDYSFEEFIGKAEAYVALMHGPDWTLDHNSLVFHERSVALELLSSLTMNFEY